LLISPTKHQPDRAVEFTAVKHLSYTEFFPAIVLPQNEARQRWMLCNGEVCGQKQQRGEL